MSERSHAAKHASNSNLGYTLSPILSIGGEVMAYRCECGNIVPVEKKKRVKRCDVCGCKNGHAALCKNGRQTEI